MAQRKGEAKSARARKECFVIGPFGEANSPIRQWSNSLMEDVVRPVAQTFGYEARRSIDHARPRDITVDMVAKLLRADLVLADLTSANANVYYELAIRHAIERPFVHVIQDGQLPPFDIKNLDVLSLPVRKNRKGVVLPDAVKCIKLLSRYISSVVDGTASFASILSEKEVGKALHAAVAEIDTRRGASAKTAASRLPQVVQKSIFKYATGVPLYYSHFDYEIELLHADGRVTYAMKVTFELVNVSDDPQTVVNRYPTPTEEFEVKEAAIDGVAVDLHDPAFFGGDAFTLRYTIPAGRSTTFYVWMTKTFTEEDNEFFSAYLYPAEKFNFRATNCSPGSLIAWVEMLHSQSAMAKRQGDVLAWSAADPILPNQGVRLLWRPK